jgi:ABC-type transport system involved in cytochrome c biogenesis ATPase subunit
VREVGLVSRPSASPTRAPDVGAPLALVVRGARKAYDVGPVARPRRHLLLRDASLRVDAGECVALHGGGAGPLTLLRCAAGLATPDAGRVAWCTRDGRRAAPPTRALVGADWRPAAACLTVRDVLQAAVPAGLGQDAADRRVEAAARASGVVALLDRPAAGLPPSSRWRVGVAAAVVAGARWLFLELPAVAPMSTACGTGAADREPDAVRAALVALRARRCTLVVSAPAGSAALLPPGRALHWRDGRAWPSVARPPAAGRRVAEAGGGAAPLTLARAPL